MCGLGFERRSFPTWVHAGIFSSSGQLRQPTPPLCPPSPHLSANTVHTLRLLSSHRALDEFCVWFHCTHHKHQGPVKSTSGNPFSSYRGPSAVQNVTSSSHRFAVFPDGLNDLNSAHSSTPVDVCLGVWSLACIPVRLPCVLALSERLHLFCRGGLHWS